jgi:hypothetical protein
MGELYLHSPICLHGIYFIFTAKMVVYKWICVGKEEMCESADAELHRSVA